jgi:hypothetical protein
MDGILRRVTERTWVGTLHGYEVHVCWSLGYWLFAVINGQGHVEVCPWAASLADGARRARAWIEARVRSGDTPGGAAAGGGGRSDDYHRPPLQAAAPPRRRRPGPAGHLGRPIGALDRERRQI